MSTITIPAPAAIQFRRPCPDIPAEQRIAIRDIAWDLYDRLSDAIGEGQNVHLAYFDPTKPPWPGGRDAGSDSRLGAHHDLRDRHSKSIQATGTTPEPKVNVVVPNPVSVVDGEA